MSLNYLPEHAENARLALALAKKEMAHLAYTHSTLFSQTITLEWVKSLAEREDLSEKIDAFVSRFGRLQDHIGEKLIPRFAALLGESPKSLLDVLAYAEKVGWVNSTAAILIMSQSADRQLVIPAWMPESSHKDVNLGVAIKPFSNTYATDKLPSVALDSGIHAGMTAMEP